MDGDAVLAAGVLAPLADEAADGLDAVAGLDADDGPEDDALPPDVAAVSEFELPPLHPPMIAAATAATTTITPSEKCPFICGISRFFEFLEGAELDGAAIMVREMLQQ